MLDDPLNVFTKKLYQFLIGHDKVKGLLIKKHSVNLQTQGEYSFTNSIKSWQEYVNKNESDLSDCSLLKYLAKDVGDIIKASEEWDLRVKVAIEINDRVHIFLNRLSAIKLALASCLSNNVRIKKCLNEKKCLAYIDPQCVGTCITYMRLKCLREAIDNLFAVNYKHLPESSKVVVTSKSSSSSIEGRLVLCGTVLNANTNSKENSLSGENFIALRQNELTLIAQHKYGVRVASDDKWKEYIAHLGESAVTYELLQTKPSSPLKVSLHTSTGSSKGAAFVLYNCARLETIIRTYNERVSEGAYPPLPDFESTDFTLLTQEDEWCLIFNYMLGVPGLLASCVCADVDGGARGGVRPHLVCGFLGGLAQLVSRYYRKTRVLTEPRRHLLPVMFARLHMLTILNDTLKNCLRILNIKSVTQMYDVLFYSVPVHWFAMRSAETQVGPSRRAARGARKRYVLFGNTEFT